MRLLDFGFRRNDEQDFAFVCIMRSLFLKKDASILGKSF